MSSAASERSVSLFGHDEDGYNSEPDQDIDDDIIDVDDDGGGGPFERDGSTSPVAGQSSKPSESDPSKPEQAQKKKKERKPGAPRATLNPARLCGPLGLDMLVKDFSDIQWKGKGHELEDFRLMMRKMENWAHSLFPKYKFDDVLEKVEHLGSKREVKTCIKKLLLDMPVLPDDFVSEKTAEPKSFHPGFRSGDSQKPASETEPFMEDFDMDVDTVTLPPRHPAAQNADRLVTRAAGGLEAVLEDLERQNSPPIHADFQDDLPDPFEDDMDQLMSQVELPVSKPTETMSMAEAMAFLDDD